MSLNEANLLILVPNICDQTAIAKGGPCLQLVDLD
jgi:hypothetical protein